MRRVYSTINLMVKNIFRFSGTLLIIVFLGGGVILTLRYFNPPSDEAQNRARVTQQMRELERLAKEDLYGGDTPEETLRLFIEALKKGDTDLAAKYFVMDKQQEWREDLAKIKEKGLLGEMVKDLERKKYQHAISDTQTIFDIANDNKEAILSIRINKISSGVWKMVDL